MKGRENILDEKFVQALKGLPKIISDLLMQVPPQQQLGIREICLRASKPLALSTMEGEMFLQKDGTLNFKPTINVYVTSKQEVDECIKILTEYSIHSHKDKINKGFITILGGHRAGIVGTSVISNGNIIAVTDISSISIRIARQIQGAATELLSHIYPQNLCSTLIVGAPSSGKTTLLRDMTRQISNGALGRYIKVSLIDERGEIASMKEGVSQNDVGVLTDVFDGYDKGTGMTIAIRSMSPKLIVLDEIGSSEDSTAIEQSMHAGVNVIATTHAASVDELTQKSHIMSLLRCGAFKKIVMLEGSQNPCKISAIMDASELFNTRKVIIAGRLR